MKKRQQSIFISTNLCRGCVNNGAWICDGCDPKGCVFYAPLPKKTVNDHQKRHPGYVLPEAA